MFSYDDAQEGPQLSAFVTDAIGSPMQLVAANGETQWQGQPDDWAAVKNACGSARQPIRFQGQWQDEESGLYYNRHRYYDPQQGRYVSQYSIGPRGGVNLYGYVKNPIAAADPLGSETTVTIWKPVGRGASPFGYVSASINDTAYSYGPSGMSVMLASEDLKNNNFRLGRGIHLDLTGEEEELLQNFMSSQYSSYSILTKNCGTPVQDCLQQLGYNFGWNILPVSLGFSLLESELFSRSEFYQPTEQAEKVMLCGHLREVLHHGQNDSICNFCSFGCLIHIELFCEE